MAQHKLLNDTIIEKANRYVCGPDNGTEAVLVEVLSDVAARGWQDGHDNACVDGDRCERHVNPFLTTPA